MKIRVECDSAAGGEAIPRRLRFDDRVVEVAAVLDRWPGRGHLYIKLRGADGALYIVRRDAAGDWQLWMMDRGG